LRPLGIFMAAIFPVSLAVVAMLQSCSWWRYIDEVAAYDDSNDDKCIVCYPDGMWYDSRVVYFHDAAPMDEPCQVTESEEKQGIKKVFISRDVPEEEYLPKKKGGQPPQCQKAFAAESSNDSHDTE